MFFFKLKNVCCDGYCLVKKSRQSLFFCKSMLLNCLLHLKVPSLVVSVKLEIQITYHKMFYNIQKGQHLFGCIWWQRRTDREKHYHFGRIAFVYSLSIPFSS